ncbi:MAG: hypothetical protein WEB60_13165 [Terrimicrobiaceae bacterium]
MKTTIDLPPDLVREMKLLAVHKGRKLKDVAVDLLERGLGREQRTSQTLPPADFLLSAPAGAPEMTPEHVRRILEETP